MVDSVYGKGWGVAASALLHAPIHRSAWNRNSANFALPEFRELRVLGFLRSSHTRSSKKFAQHPNS
jgi:hypothetical protein